MTRIFLLMAWIMTQGTQKGEGAEECGGVLTGERGVIQTPSFPHKFVVPLHCHWVIDASHQAGSEDSFIAVYFTQLFVTSGLSFTEYDYYEAESTFHLGGRLIHKVTEQNVTSVQWLMTHRHYLVIDFTMDRLEGNHLRVLDGLLDVFGFNFTYETGKPVRNSSCSVVGCSLSGHCYASDDFGDYWCDCFPGFSGEDCGHGPLCGEDSVCLNGAVCRQAGAAAVVCLCPEGFTGSKCETALHNDGCEEEGGCTTQCPEDGLAEPCACGANAAPVTRDRARYEGTVRLTNVSAVRTCLESATCSLKTLLTKQITKYLRSSNLSVMEDLRVIDVGFSGEVRFHFWGGKRDGSRVRDSLNRLVQRGRLGNVSLVPTHLAITQEPTLLLERLDLPKPLVRQGEKFILTCVAQGSSHLTFHWFKDDILINTTRARRSMWTRLLPLHSTEQEYTSLLGVEQADPLDAGRYTCQVTDWGYQQCKSVVMEVLQPPVIKLDPMSVTVEKGDNVTVKCTSPNELQYESRFGYSWTKNNALFKMKADLEFWEDLHPGGSILRIYNVQKSAVYSCHVHGAARSVSRSVRLELLNRSVVPWCPATPMSGAVAGGVRWRWAGPGVTAKEECPSRYQGVATRLCLLVDKDQAAWQTPDFSDCVSDKVSSIANDFYRVTLGHGNTTVAATLSALLLTLHGRGATYPGEGEPVVTLLGRLIDYINTTAPPDDMTNSTDHFYGVVNSLLLQRNSIIHHQKVEELQAVVTQWALLWGAQGATASAHLALDTLVADLFRFDGSASRRGLTLSLPRPSLSYPAWYSSRITLHGESNKKAHNSTSSVAVIVYNKLSEFLPQRYSQVLENGSEVQYEVASALVSVVAHGPLRVQPEVELLWMPRVGWELRCGATLSPSAAWNITICSAYPQSSNLTLCVCPTLGTYAALLVKVINMNEASEKRPFARIVLVGCVCCLVQSLVALSLLAVRWYRHTTSLLFLKLQCCAATATAMTMFLYATNNTLSQEAFPVVSTVLQAAVMVSLSSHLSKVLLIYTEVYLPTVRHLRQTIICIITGVPLLVVLCNHIAQTTMDSPLPSWWLTHGSMVYYTCTAYTMFLLSTFVLLFYLVTKRLRSLTVVKGSDTKKAILRRQGLLNRAAVVLGATVIMSASSCIYINGPSTRSQYLFSFTSALLGFAILMCYVLHCESPLHLNLLRILKLDNSYSSESDSSPLNIFTKQEADRECEGAPLTVLEAGPCTAACTAPCTAACTAPCTVAPLRNGKAEPVREAPAPPILKTKTDDCCRTPTRPKAVTFHNDLVTGCDRGSVEPVDMETYPASPRKYPVYDPRYSPLVSDGSARVCVITSVVVDTPSVVVCSVDVEPCSVLSQSIVHAGVQDPVDPPAHPEILETPTTPDDEGDVMDRICHDLNYLLGGLPQEIKAEIPRPDDAVDSAAPVGLIQQTSL